jgi:hypothetical protein
MPDRLAELRRQRALIADHLAWLDREIAAAAVPIQPPVPPSSTILEPPAQPFAPKPPLEPAAILTAAKPSPAPTAVLPETDSHAHLLPEHQPADVKQDVRRGCFLYFALAAVAVIGGTGLLVWAARSAWFRTEVSPYLAKVFFVALLLILVAGIRGIISKFRQ